MQEVERVESELLREVVDRAVLPEHRVPGDDADQIRRPERREHEDEERYLLAQALDLREEVGDRIADRERTARRRRRRAGTCAAAPSGRSSVPERAVVLGRPVPGVEAVGAALPERDEHDHDDRREQEDAQPERRREGPQERGEARALDARGRGDGVRLLAELRLDLGDLRQRSVLAPGEVLRAQGRARPRRSSSP